MFVTNFVSFIVKVLNISIYCNILLRMHIFIFRMQEFNENNVFKVPISENVTDQNNKQDIQKLV